MDVLPSRRDVQSRQCGDACDHARHPPAPLVVEEISIAGCFLLLRDDGLITIPITGYPGAAPTFRIMMHPDGVRLGLEALETAIDATIERTAEAQTMMAFQGLPARVAKLADAFDHLTFASIPGADHAYTHQRAEVWHLVRQWLEAV